MAANLDLLAGLDPERKIQGSLLHLSGGDLRLAASTPQWGDLRLAAMVQGEVGANGAASVGVGVEQSLAEKNTTAKPIPTPRV